MNNKKMIAVFMALGMTMMCFSGCSLTEESTSAPTAAPSPQATATAAPKATATPTPKTTATPKPSSTGSQSSAGSQSGRDVYKRQTQQRKKKQFPEPALCSPGYWRTERDFRGGSDSHYRSECREASFSSHKIESYKIKSYKKLLWKLFQVNKICSSFYIRLSFLIFIAGVVISGTVIIAIIFCFLRGIPGTVIIAVRSSV